MKLPRRTLIVAFIFLLVWLMPRKVAAADYEITSYHVKVKVQKNGSAQVERQIKYDFDDHTNGVYYTQALRTDTNQKLSKAKVTIIQGGHRQPIKLSDSGQANTYQLFKKQHSYQFKVFHPVDDGEFTVVYRYQLDKVVKNYQDTAEINWKIIGAGWDEELNNVRIEIALPATKIASLQAWAHGNLDGYNKVDKKQGKVILSLDKNPANTFIETHIVFAPTITAENTFRSSKKRLKQIREQEASLAAKANAERKRNQIRKTIWQFVLITLAFVIMAVQLGKFLKHKPNRLVPYRPKKAPHVFDTPSYSAAVSQILCFDQQPDGRAFSGHLLELAAKKQIKIDRAEKNNFQLTLLNPDLLENQQETLLAELFSLGDGKQFNSSSLKLNRPKAKLIAQKYEAWQEAEYQKAQELHYRNDLPSISRLTISLVAGVFCLGIANQFFGASFNWIIVGTLISLGIWLFVKFNYSPYTKAGVSMMNQVRGYYSMLHDIGQFDRKVLEDQILWEEVMPYAVAFGLAPKVVKTLQANFSQEEINYLLPNYYYFVLLDSMKDNFAETFDNFFADAVQQTTSHSSSINGSSGGFSGGSSGGFGGGSGGGAF
ncbi:DUF2207 domain-containing protein [Lactobacillus corticis]|uniref:DUF2207 domain-containing protein n=1 Tax=Lactobacillus corticis TaxID=2201249 RepID=A0A916QKM2_9LACO|nr:DUF2207 domain-containing protein [Lactobacillus corticis]GFZ27678.1 hypothetical protein LCB40_15580 [Lactobacillus corticis]